MIGGIPPRGNQTMLPLHGRSILVAEDEPIIAIEIERGLTNAGAGVVRARGRKRALELAQDSGLSAAVIDFALRDGDATAVCRCLRQREIPFMIYSGYRRFPVACRAEVVVRKPVHPDVIVRAVVDLCRRHRAKARPQRLVRSGALDPPRLAMLGQVYHAVWTDIGVEFGSDPRVIATAQGVLASIIIDFAWDGQFGAPELTRIAGRLMRNFIDPTTTRTPTAKKSPPR